MVSLALATVVFGQEPLTIAAALDEAVASNPELRALRLEPPADRVAALVRAAQILADVRRAHAELAITRRTLELHVGQAPMLREMADAAAIRPGPGEMSRHDPSAMLLDIARLSAARITAQEQVKVAELRLNAILGRPLEAPVQALAMSEAATLPEGAVAIALGRDPRLAAASNASRDAVEIEVRRRVLEARARVEGARERATIMTTTVLPQVAIAFDNARAAYTTNQAGFFEMLDAHHRQLEASVENAARAAEYERALVAFDVAMGETPERLARAVGPGPLGK
jgi:outer membrane protein TolC